MDSALQTSLLVSAAGIGLFLVLLLLIMGLAAALGRAKPTPQRPPADPRAVLAPSEGSVISVAVQPGRTVTIGQELCILETGQSKTAVRAGRVGVINAVHVLPGDLVQAGQVLMEFGD